MNNVETTAGNNEESLIQNEYKIVERGDLDPVLLGNSSGVNTPTQNNTSVSTTTISSPRENNQVDLGKLFTDLVSLGFTPTTNLMRNATSYLEGPDDSSNTWFAILFQKLLKQKKYQKKKLQK